MTNEVLEFLDSLRDDEYSENTVMQYGRHLWQLRDYLHREHFRCHSEVPIDGITAKMLKEYNISLKNNGTSTSSRATYLAPVRAFFQYSFEIQLIRSNPAAHISSGRTSKKERADQAARRKRPKYTSKDFEDFLTFLRSLPKTKVNLRNIAVLTMFVASGLRAFELCSLNISDMDAIRQGELRCVQKGGYISTAAVAPFCIPFIDEYLRSRGPFNANDPLFLSQKGHRLNPNSCWKALATAQRNAPANLSTGIHCFRALALTSVYEKGNVAIARDAGRHKRAVTTQDHYIKTTTAQVRRALDDTVLAATVRAQPVV